MLTKGEDTETIAAGKTGLDLKGVLQRLCTNYSTEVTPAAAGKIERFDDLLPKGTHVYITSLPGSDYLEVVAVASRLAAEGMKPIPHLAARNIADVAQLKDFIERATGEAGVDSTLVIAGALDRPSGEFADSTHLLRTGLLEKHGITTIGVAGHPESCECCSDAELWAALAWKQEYARRTGLGANIVTQFAFEAEPFIDYDCSLTAKGFDLPLHIGVPGIANLKTLIGFAMSCGVGNSINFLKRQARNVSKLLQPSAPDKLLLDLAQHVASQPETSIAKLHMFPLGGIKKTAHWINAVSAGRFEIKSDLSGFSVDTDRL